MKDKDHIIQMVRTFVRNAPGNQFRETDGRFFDEPIVGVASADDPLFSDYKTIVGNRHVTPKEVFDLEFGSDSFRGGSVISVALPISEKIRRSNRGQKDWPSKEWILYRSFGDEVFLETIGPYVEKLIAEMGYRAITPHRTKHYVTFVTPAGPCSNWSERHVAYAAGLGTFSLNDGFITEKGMAVRFISVITDLILEADCRIAKNYRSNCLFYSPDSCSACIKRCPISAITEAGHDKFACYAYVYGEASSRLAVSHGGFAKAGAGCGLCQTGTPCEYKNPVT
ncbi:MAG: (Fe-S)-binding protein [Clostridiales bacterium]|jgi:epoxyqueuosine reductase QueG|nr:(Fe-S)-binding protein [Clostridiales bacterium]